MEAAEKFICGTACREEGGGHSLCCSSASTRSQQQCLHQKSFLVVGRSVIYVWPETLIDEKRREEMIVTFWVQLESSIPYVETRDSRVCDQKSTRDVVAHMHTYTGIHVSYVCMYKSAIWTVMHVCMYIRYDRVR